MTEIVSFDPTPAAPPRQSTAWEDALDIFYAPRAVFERRKDGKYWVALIILSVVGVAIYFLSAQYNDVVADMEFSRAMAEQVKKGVKMTPEAIAQTKAFAEKFKAVLVYMLPIFQVLSAWISGLIIMLLGNMMGGKMNFAQGATIGVLANFPEMLGRIAVGVQGLFLDLNTVTSKYSFATSAARFMAADSNKFLLKLAALADPFVIWSAVLVGVGAFVIGRVEKEKAAVLAIIHALGFALLAR
jgi:Yip1 domain